MQGDRVDIEYLNGISLLALRPETRICLGLINPDEGLPGAAARLVAAQRFIQDFGIATACSWGRLPAVASTL